MMVVLRGLWMSLIRGEEKVEWLTTRVAGGETVCGEGEYWNKKTLSRDSQAPSSGLPYVGQEHIQATGHGLPSIFEQHHTDATNTNYFQP